MSTNSELVGPRHAAPADPAAGAAGGPTAVDRPDAVVALTGVSRWYGNVVAVNDVTMALGPGVT